MDSEICRHRENLSFTFHYIFEREALCKVSKILQIANTPNLYQTIFTAYKTRNITHKIYFKKPVPRWAFFV